MDEHTYALFRRVTRPRGGSTFLATAAKAQLARHALIGLLNHLDAKHGAPSAAIRTEVARHARRIFRLR